MFDEMYGPDSAPRAPYATIAHWLDAMAPDMLRAKKGRSVRHWLACC